MSMQWRRAILMAGFLAGFACSQSRAADPAHSAADQREIGAIYSSLLHNGDVFKNLGRSQDQCWAVADTTVNIDDMSPSLAPDAQLKPPGNDPKPFQEALADFNARKYQRVTLAHTSSSQYVVLSPAEATAFRAARTSLTDDDTDQKYSNCGGITYFSDVYFSARRTAALVYMLNWCGSLCGQGEWVYLEKRDGQWALRSGQAGIVSGAKPF
jgi:hypothetical protein